MRQTMEGLRTLLQEEAGQPSKSAFYRASDYVIRGWAERKSCKGLAPTETDVGFLKRGAYHVILHFMDQHHGSAYIRHQVSADGRVPKQGPSFDDNPFHWGLLAMFLDREIISKDRRRLFANQMLYAHWHEVPEHLFIGFIYQLGRTDRIYAKVKQGQLEPCFRAARP